MLKALFGAAAIVRTELPFAIDRHNKSGADIGVVDPFGTRTARRRQMVTVTRNNGGDALTTEDDVDDLIPVSFFGVAGQIPVEDIFTF